MLGLRLRKNRRSRNALRDGNLQRLCTEILQSLPDHATRQELTKANNIWQAVRTKLNSDDNTPDTLGWIRARNLLCKSTAAAEQHRLSQPPRKGREDIRILFWNCNGMKSAAKKHILRQTVSANSIDIVSLAETKTSYLFPELAEFRTSTHLPGQRKGGASQKTDLMGGLWSGVAEEADIRSKRIPSTTNSNFIEYRFCRYLKQDVSFTHVSAYIPGPSKARGKPRLDNFLTEVLELHSTGPLLVTADFNCDLNDMRSGLGKQVFTSLIREGWIVHNPVDDTGKYLPTCIRSSSGSTIDLVLSKNWPYAISCDILPLSTDDHQGIMITIHVKKVKRRKQDADSCTPYMAKRLAEALEDEEAELHDCAAAAVARHMGTLQTHSDNPLMQGAMAELLRISNSMSPLRPLSPTEFPTDDHTDYNHEHSRESDGDSTTVYQGSPRASPDPPIDDATTELIRMRDSIPPMQPWSPSIEPPVAEIVEEHHEAQQFRREVEDQELTEMWGFERIIEIILNLLFSIHKVLHQITLFFLALLRPSRPSLRPVRAARTELVWRPEGILEGIAHSPIAENSDILEFPLEFDHSDATAHMESLSQQPRSLPSSAISGLVKAVNDFARSRPSAPRLDPLYLAWKKSCDEVSKLRRYSNSKSIRRTHKALSQIHRHRHKARAIVAAIESRVISDKAFTTMQHALEQKTTTAIGKHLDRGMRTRGAMLDAIAIGEEGLQTHREFWTAEVGLKRELPSNRESIVKEFLQNRTDIPQSTRASPFSVTRKPDGSFWKVTEEELTDAVKSMAWHRAPGPTGIPVDVYKTSPSLRETLLIPFNDIIQGLPAPIEFNLCRLILLFKKGDRLLPANYRPINLTEAAYRVFETVLKRRMNLWFESQLDENQHGFRHKQSTVTALFRLCCTVQIATKNKKPLFAAFLDAVKAYDRVPHSAVIEALASRGIDQESCQLILTLLSNHVTRFQDMLDAALNFEVALNSGVMQGGILSPQLFSLFIDVMAEIAEMESQTILYADDRSVLDDDDRRLQDTLRRLEACGTPAHLRHNVQKNEAVHFNSHRPTFNLEGAPIPIKFEIVTLGITLNAKGKMYRANATSTANMTCMRVAKIWLIAKRATFSMFRTLVNSYSLPSALYCSTVCDITKAKLVQIERSVSETIRAATHCHRTTNRILLYEFSGIIRPQVRVSLQLVSDWCNIMMNPFPRIRELVATSTSENLPVFQKLESLMSSLKFPASGDPPATIFKNINNSEPQVDEEVEEEQQHFIPTKPSSSHLIAFTDGSSDPNPGPTGCATVVLFNNHIYLEGFFLGEMLTNNIAEWTAALKAILKAVDLQARNVTIVTDSLGVVMGLRGMSSITEAPLAHILRQIRTLVQQNSIFLTVKWVEAHKKDGNYFNDMADNIAGYASKNQRDTHQERPATQWELDRATEPIPWGKSEVIENTRAARISLFQTVTTNAIMSQEHDNYVASLSHIRPTLVNFPGVGSAAALKCTGPGGGYMIELRRCRQQHFKDHDLFEFMHGCTLCSQCKEEPMTVSHILECSLDSLRPRDHSIIKRFRNTVKRLRPHFRNAPIPKTEPESITELLQWATSSQSPEDAGLNKLVTRTRSLILVLNNRYRTMSPPPLQRPSPIIREPMHDLQEGAGDYHAQESAAHRFSQSTTESQRVVILDRMQDCRTPEEFKRWEKWSSRALSTMHRWHVKLKRQGHQAVGYLEFLQWCQDYLTVIACPTWELREEAWNRYLPLRGSRTQPGLKGIRARFHYLGTKICGMLREDTQWPFFMDWTFTATTPLAEAWFAAPTSLEQRNLLGSAWPPEWSKTDTIKLRRLSVDQYRRTSLPKSLHGLFKILHDAIEFHEISLQPEPERLPLKNNDWNRYCRTVVRMILTPIEALRNTDTIIINPINVSRSSLHFPDNSKNRSQNPTFPQAITPHPPRVDVFTNTSRILTARTPSEAIDIARSWTNIRLENLGIPKQFPNDSFPALPPRTSDLDEPSNEDSQQEDDLLTIDGLSDSATSSSNSPSPPTRTNRRRGAHGRDH